MLKIDRKIVQEFLSTTDVSEYISPLKCCRFYRSNNDRSKFILILTPLLHDDNDYVNNMLEFHEGLTYKHTEHKRGNNFVYTFQKITDPNCT